MLLTLRLQAIPQAQIPRLPDREMVVTHQGRDICFLEFAPLSARPTRMAGIREEFVLCSPLCVDTYRGNHPMLAKGTDTGHPLSVTPVLVAQNLDNVVTY